MDLVLASIQLLLVCISCLLISNLNSNPDSELEVVRSALLQSGPPGTNKKSPGPARLF